MKKLLETASTILLAITCVAVLWSVYTNQRPSAAQAQRQPDVEDIRETIPAERIRNITGTGSLVFAEFTDFQCPFCARHTKETVPALLKLPNVRYVSMHLPLQSHSQAIPAAEFAECAAEQGKYWEAHTLLFENQAQLQTGTLPTVPGVDAKLSQTCLDADKALARVKADRAEAGRLGANSTPTVFIGRMRSDGGVDLLKRINGAHPVETFAAEIAKLTEG
jgi:protein-disulfide isomerase